MATEVIKPFKQEGDKFFYNTPEGVTTIERTAVGCYTFGGVAPLNVTLLIDFKKIQIKTLE